MNSKEKTVDCLENAMALICNPPDVTEEDLRTAYKYLLELEGLLEEQYKA